MNTEHDDHLQKSRELWDAEAASFDHAPDHGLRDPVTLAAWTKLLQDSLSTVQGEVLDIGCGTGSLSLVLAQLGYTVTGIDLSPAMIALAKKKAAASGHNIVFHVMDAAFPQLPAQQFDAIVCRHLLWMLPEPANVLQRWANLLKPDGRLLLIEGFWHTGAGLRARDLYALIPSSMSHIKIKPLSDQTDLWGGEVTDERYVIMANRAP